MIEPLKTYAIGEPTQAEIRRKINELVDFANGVTKSMLEQTVIQLDGEKVKEIVAEPTESKTSSAEKVLKYCRQKGVMCENSSNLGFCSLTACNKEQYNMQSIIKPTEKMYTIDEVAGMLYGLFGDPPCDFNDMDEKCDEFCDKQCYLGGDYTEEELAEHQRNCWKHAIQSGWLKGE